ncbi:fluoride efflux transporter FluC [Bifidobacterium jacchi]|uniref:Fluoride-specific ion channel FluC n=1 Tax=Bifidobacterium jacchi TaxID=2490545 RepID=A0A5N5RKX4_9BIFI|nr:CrcB family protein [Bifidobacterium jacchi]KAB5607938.1 CrcB family protein [Bifidobacterium jacchi]
MTDDSSGESQPSNSTGIPADSAAGVAAGIAADSPAGSAAGGRASGITDSAAGSPPSNTAGSTTESAAEPATMEFAATGPAAALSDRQPPKIPLAPMKRMQARFNPLADAMLYLVVFAGGFFGTAMRYGLSALMPRPAAANGFWSAFHPATFIANMIATFVFAALAAYMSQATWIRKRSRELVSRGVGMGMCGGFSTLSAMVIEELTSIRAGQIGGFVFYMMISFICGLLVAALGVHLAIAIGGKRAARVARRQVEHAVHAGGASRAGGVSDAADAGDASRAGSVGGLSNNPEMLRELRDAIPSFEPEPITDEVPLVEDPMRGEAHE